MVDGERVDAEADLQLGVLEEVVDHHLGDGVALQLDDHAGILVRFIADGADIGDDLFIDQSGNTLHQRGTVHIVRNLGDDDLLAPTLDFLHSGTTTDLHRSTTRLKILADTADAAELATCGKIRPLDIFHQLVKRDVRIVDLGTGRVDGLAEIVRRYIGSHADGDPSASIDQQIWNRGGENGRLLTRVVVVWNEVHRIMVHILHEDGSQGTQTCLSVSHGSRRITFNGTEISLTLDQGFTHRPSLGHVHERRIDRLVTMRMVVTHRLADDLGALEMLTCRHDTEFAHCKKDAALGGLQAIAGIGKRAGNNDRHRVVEKGSRNLHGHINRFYFFVLIIQGIGPLGRLGVDTPQDRGL